MAEGDEDQAKKDEAARAAAEKAKGGGGNDDDDELGESGKRALQREREKRRELEREAAELRTAAAELQTIKDKDKSESQREKEAREKAEARASDAETKLLRMEVASDKGLPAGAWKRLTGTTKEELEEDADELAKLLNVKPTRQRTKTDLDASGGGDNSGSMDDLIRARAGR